jgi:hypothetical protein
MKNNPKNKKVEINKDEYHTKIKIVLDRVDILKKVSIGMREKLGLKAASSALEKALKTINESDDTTMKAKDKKKLDQIIEQLDNYTTIVYRDKALLLK